MQRIQPVLNLLGGWLMVIIGCYVVYRATTTLWENGWPWPAQLCACVGLMLAALLIFDNGLGLMFRQDTTPRLVEQAGVTDDLFLLFHGYNGNRRSLIEIMGPELAPYGKVVAFEPSLDGYDHDALLEEVEEAINRYQPNRIFAYFESYGGMIGAELLRRNPALHFHSITLNAAPAKPSHIRLAGRALRLFNYIHGGPISTAVARWKQRLDVANSPALEAGANAEVARRAQQRSLRVTAPMAFDQLGYMGSFDPVKPGEFKRRAGVVRFVHAPGAADAFINNAEASTDWRAAFPDANFLDVTTSWPEGMHTPTPERPSEVIATILQTLPTN